MSEKKITVAIVGLGSRGNSYASSCALLSDKVEIVACADIDPDKLQRFSKKYNIKPEMQFNSAEELLQQDKLADVLFVCTLDQLHYPHSIPALKKGYHLLLEKPASNDPVECMEIARVANEYNRKVVVCHVMRYTAFLRTLKSILDSGKIGDIMCIQANEGVCFWHQAHSFVRGNWRDKNTTSPMLLQKCCHDMDMFLWLTGKHCKSITSFGTLSHFKPECAPEGATQRCNEGCPHYYTCPYSIKPCYLDWGEKGIFTWPMDVVSQEPTMESLKKNLEEGQYGRCVYFCDNNVVDHQVVNMLFDDDLMINFNMCAFTETSGGRNIHIMGTKGEIKTPIGGDKIEVNVFRQPAEFVPVQDVNDEFGHGGGDMGIVEDIVDLLLDEGANKESVTSIDVSIESHIMCIAAEESRENGGKLIDIADFTEELKKQVK